MTMLVPIVWLGSRTSLLGDRSCRVSKRQTHDLRQMALPIQGLPAPAVDGWSRPHHRLPSCAARLMRPPCEPRSTPPAAPIPN